MTSAAKRRVVDPTFYPVEEKLGEDSLQTFTAELFRGLVERHLALKGKPCFVGADQFIYWVQHHPEKVLAPDVYVLPGVPQDGRVTCLKTWEAGVVPSFALEIVSPNSVDKDYRLAPERYAELGVAELVIFDPDYRRGRDRLRFQVFRPVRGKFTRVTVTGEDRVRSRVLGCWIRSVGTGGGTRLRLAGGEEGDTLIQTEAEAERARAEAEHGRAEVERTRAEFEKNRADQAEDVIARLRAEIERIQRGR
jgi:hypothetical protein